MGAWSYESFGNDDACDWIAQLEEHNDLGFVESTLDAVLAVGDDYLEAPEACEAIAAAKVVARLRGDAGSGIPVQRMSTPGGACQAAALGDLDRQGSPRP